MNRRRLEMTKSVQLINIIRSQTEKSCCRKPRACSRNKSASKLAAYDCFATQRGLARLISGALDSAAVPHNLLHGARTLNMDHLTRKHSIASYSTGSGGVGKVQT